MSYFNSNSEVCQHTILQTHLTVLIGEHYLIVRVKFPRHVVGIQDGHFTAMPDLLSCHPDVSVGDGQDAAGAKRGCTYCTKTLSGSRYLYHRMGGQEWGQVGFAIIKW